MVLWILWIRKQFINNCCWGFCCCFHLWRLLNFMLLTTMTHCSTWDTHVVLQVLLPMVRLYQQWWVIYSTFNRHSVVSTAQPAYLHDLPPGRTRSSSLITITRPIVHPHLPLSKSQIALSVMHHPVFGIIFLLHSINLSPPSLPLSLELD